MIIYYFWSQEYAPPNLPICISLIDFLPGWSERCDGDSTRPGDPSDHSGCATLLRGVPAKYGAEKCNGEGIEKKILQIITIIIITRWKIFSLALKTVCQGELWRKRTDSTMKSQQSISSSSTSSSSVLSSSASISLIWPCWIGVFAIWIKSCNLFLEIASLRCIHFAGNETISNIITLILQWN